MSYLEGQQGISPPFGFSLFPYNLFRHNISTEKTNGDSTYALAAFLRPRRITAVYLFLEFILGV